jgi:hypothetical protein
MTATRPDPEILLRLTGPFVAVRAGVPLTGAGLGWPEHGEGIFVGGGAPGATVRHGR